MRIQKVPWFTTWFAFFRKWCSGRRALIVLVALALCMGGVLAWSVAGYWAFPRTASSKISPALRVFAFNESKHVTDPVPGCWYDSGDYIVLVQRNLQSLFYLSLALQHAQTTPVREDLERIIRKQLRCVDQMLNASVKQFRDQESHIALVPPVLNELLTPQTTYRFRAEEGRDVFLLRALVAEHLGDRDAETWKTRASAFRHRTRSEQCCEEGPLVFSNDELIGIESLAFPKKPMDLPYGWSIGFTNVAALEQGNYERIRVLLAKEVARWEEAHFSYGYIGGNYDIAGTIALERWYARQTGDATYFPLSQEFYRYLRGQNHYNVDFTRVAAMHHPCGSWWARCQLEQTLVNGVDEKEEFDLTRPDIWRLTEVQLVGQAKYVLMRVLYEGL